MKRYKMRGVGKGVFGYTIVEALIFLAVSGLLLVSVAGLISGRQERTMFANAVNDVQQDLLDTFNDVTSGYYPSNDNVTCRLIGGTISLVDGNAESGTNSDCMYVGKAIEFNTGGTGFTAYTMVASRNMSESSINFNHIKLVGKGNNAVGIADTKDNNLDLQTKKITTDGTSTYSSLIVMANLGTDTANIVNFSGNANKLTLYGVEGPLTGVEGNINESNIRTIGSDVTICLEQPGGGDKRKAYLIVTPQLTIERTIGSKAEVCP